MSYSSLFAEDSTVALAPQTPCLPTRSTPTWERVETTTVHTRSDLGKVITGRFPIGLLPGDVITEEERLAIVRGLRAMPIQKYNNTADTEKVSVHGRTFVDAPSLDEYLRAERDEAFEDLTTPLLSRVAQVFSGYGFNVAPLIDDVTGLPYHAKVCREISIPDDCYTPAGNDCTVLHCDDILRDGHRKPGFRIPAALEGMRFNQFSVCIQLEDGGYRPDDLIVYEKQYSREMEGQFYGDGGWRYDAAGVQAVRSHAYTPELRRCYLFSTLAFHDVRGGHRLSQRINFSVFFLYVPGTNTLYYYN